MKTLILIAAVALTGCQHMGYVNVAEIPANLKVPCDPWPELEDGRGSTIVLWAPQVKRNYDNCASRHQRLVEAFTPKK